MESVPNVGKLNVKYLLIIEMFFLSFCATWATPVDEQAANATILLQPGTVIEFSDVEAGREILTTRDVFLDSVGPFDRSLALQTAKPVSQKKYVDFIGKQVLEWNEKEKELFRQSIGRISERMAPFKLRMPKKIMFVKSTGRDMMECAYCRPSAVVFPVNMINMCIFEAEYSGSSETLDYLLVHELFHVYSASNKPLRDELYGLIGYKRCNTIPLPEKLDKIVFTNPDYPINNYYVEFEYNNETVQAISLCYSNTPVYDKSRGKHLAFYLNTGMLLIEKKEGKWQCKLKDGEPVILSMIDAWNYFSRIGFNTTYILDAEEVITENWCRLVLEEPPYQTPAIIEKLKVFLGKHANDKKQD
ncbi:MAG: hypothetical protein KAS23_13000 [Anaerohalosphaera sp.]|nr:hypothetical protein [Anaerohalosphaera sp.]